MDLTPYQQQRRARILALRPEQRAILGVAVEDDEAQSAGENAADELALTRLGMAKQATEAHQGLQRQRLDTQANLANREMALQRRSLDDSIGAAKRSEMLGWGNLAVSGLTGWGQMNKEEERAKQLGALAALYR